MIFRMLKHASFQSDTQKDADHIGVFRTFLRVLERLAPRPRRTGLYFNENAVHEKA